MGKVNPPGGMMFKKIERTATIGHRLMPPPQNPRMILVKILLGCLPKVSYIACTVKLKYSFIKLKFQVKIQSNQPKVDQADR